MANVQVIQRNAHLAGGVRLEMVNGREGKVAKALPTAISNTRRSFARSSALPLVRQRHSVQAGP